MNKKIIFFSSLCILFISIYWINKNSANQFNKAFYFWENNRTSLSKFEINELEELKTNKLYVKFFEVEKNEIHGIIPSAKSELRLSRKELDQIEIIPTVYIRNSVFKNTSKKELIDLSENIYSLIKKKYTESFQFSKNTLKELQIDCDWTESSKENYFYFLKQLDKVSLAKISATLRLYAYKFPEKMGVLPVDRVMLMCYNLLSPLEAGNRNSILELEELKKYLIGAKKYPLPLDVALPIYSAIHIYQNNKFRGMLYGENRKLVKRTKSTKGLWHTIKKDTLVNQIFIRKGDKIKFEFNSPNKIKKAIDIIKSNVIFEGQTTIVLYHLQETELKQYSNEELANFYTLFKH